MNKNIFNFIYIYQDEISLENKNQNEIAYGSKKKYPRTNFISVDLGINSDDDMPWL